MKFIRLTKKFFSLLVFLSIALVSIHSFDQPSLVGSTKASVNTKRLKQRRANKIDDRLNDGRQTPLSRPAYNNYPSTSKQSLSSSAPATSPISDPPTRNNIERAFPFLGQVGFIAAAVQFLALTIRNLGVLDIIDQIDPYNSLNLFHTPLLALAQLFVVLNIGGLLGSLFRPNGTKALNKALLGANILRESCGAVMNVALILLSSNAVDSGVYRDKYAGRLLMNLFWGYLCYSMIKLRWVSKIEPMMNPDSPHLKQYMQQQEQQFRN